MEMRELLKRNNATTTSIITARACGLSVSGKVVNRGSRGTGIGGIIQQSLDTFQLLQGLRLFRDTIG